MNRVFAFCLSFLTVLVVVESRNATIDWLIKHKFVRFDDEQASDNAPLITDTERIINGVKEFQRTAGFPVTGYLTEIQINATQTPLCLSTSVPSSNGTENLVFFWNKAEITWRYFPPYYSSRILPLHIVESMIQRAFDVWTQDIPLKAYKEQGAARADVNVHFYYGDHVRQSPICNNSAFDGVGGVLGHGFYPEIGELHLDLSERWGIFKETFSHADHYTDLFSVIYHEVGHILGIRHSPFELDTAMRFAYSAPRQHWRNYEINPYDALAIKRLYPGNNQLPSIDMWDLTTTAVTSDELKPTVTRGPTRNPYNPTHPNNPKITHAVRLFDAVLGSTNELILFKDRNLWRLSYYGIIQGYPTTLDNFFSGYHVPKIVDSIYTRKVDNYIIIFSGNLYYRYNGNRLVHGYPKRIVDLLGANDRIIDIKPMQDADYLVFYVGQSYVFLFNEYTNRVVYIMDFKHTQSSMLSDDSVGIPSNSDIPKLEFVNENDLYVNSGIVTATPIIFNTFIIIILLQLCK